MCCLRGAVSGLGLGVLGFVRVRVGYRVLDLRLGLFVRVRVSLGLVMVSNTTVLRHISLMCPLLSMLISIAPRKLHMPHISFQMPVYCQYPRFTFIIGYSILLNNFETNSLVCKP